MDAAFDNYLAMSPLLRGDMEALLDQESDSQQWRRNFIRASAALLEGYAHCLREMCAVGDSCDSPTLSSKESGVVHSEKGFDANERLKYTLRAAYKRFELTPMPDFGGTEWTRAQRILVKRHLLMHPKSPADLEVSNDFWSEAREDVAWLFEKFFNLFKLLQEKHGR